jgi:hypothetical protein
MSWLGRSASRYGPLDRLRIVDEDNERIYLVDARGVLVGAEIFSLRGVNCVQSQPLAVLATIPEGDIFSPESLERSVVSEAYRRAPAQIDTRLWSRGRRCLPDRRRPR